MNETSKIEIRCRRNKQEEQEAVSGQAGGVCGFISFSFGQNLKVRFGSGKCQSIVQGIVDWKERKEMSFVTRLSCSAATSNNHHNQVLAFKSRKVKATKIGGSGKGQRSEVRWKLLRVRTFGDVGQGARLAAALPAPPVLESVPVVNHLSALYVVFYVFVEEF